MTESVIPISKTPSQEKLVFVPPKLDWNENGNLRGKSEKLFPTLQSDKKWKMKVFLSKK
jgi:hypothetical protein